MVYKLLRGRAIKKGQKNKRATKGRNQYAAKVLNQRANAVRPYKKIIAAGDTIIPHSSFLIYLPPVAFSPQVCYNDLNRLYRMEVTKCEKKTKTFRKPRTIKRKATSLLASFSTQTLTWIGSDLKSF